MRWKDNGQGFLRKNLRGKLTYESFVPGPLDTIIPLKLDDETIRNLTACSRMLGKLEGMLRFIPNAPMYLAMYVRKEALLSAQIEGTQCTFDDILNPDNVPLVKSEVADVISYVRATKLAVEEMRNMPLCLRLLRKVHATLLEGIRGAERDPGMVRSSQNWIGPAGCTLREAAYIPPNVDDMNVALGGLDRFLNESHNVDPIVKAALAHYQFETIHPFLDGNGRLGRLLITLSLLNDNVMSGAVFYPSYQLKLHRSEYYERLMDVRQNGSYAKWVAFFCECLLASATDADDALTHIVMLHNDNANLVNDRLGRSASNGQRLLELLEGNPIVNIGFVCEHLGISRTTVARLVHDFERLDILQRRDAGKQRYRVYLYEAYLTILRQGSDPL